ncbi:MAG: hypothetical protein U0W40_17465 [Acidimicrobiia bacterium]
MTLTVGGNDVGFVTRVRLQQPRRRVLRAIPPSSTSSSRPRRAIKQDLYGIRPSYKAKIVIARVPARIVGL